MTTDTDFESAFDEVETPVEDSPVEQPADDLPADEPVDDVPADEPPAEEAVEPAPIDEPPAEPAPAEPAAPTAPTQQELDPKYLAQAIAEAQAQLQAQQAPAAPTEEPKEATFVDFLDDKDKAALEVFKSEWSEVAAPVTALINAHVRAALVNQEKQILGRMEQHLAPIQQVTAQSQEAAHRAAIAAAHPDFMEVVTALPEWIGKQPSLIQPALRQAYERGTTAEVVELLAHYKQAIGPTGAAPVSPASSAAQVQQPAAPISKAALAATMAPPAAKRSNVSTSRDPNDFEAAFNEGL
jgi:hypothetical protein